MEIKLYKTSKIYILTPANVATWGVELLHQLSYKINSILWFDNVFIKYVWEKDWINPTPKDYIKYGVKSINKIEDKEENVLIVPEIFTQYLFEFTKIRKVVWRLSIDNYYFNISFFPKVYNYFLLKLFNKQNYICFNNKLKKIDYHLVQCEYAKQHLLKKWIPQKNIYYLSDYLNKDFLDNIFDIRNKENIVVYNPKKWYKFTKKLIQYMNKQCDNVKFVPIQNMTRQQVIDLLKKSKIYIDFWYFPWKDRIPRESAILGNIIIISKMWAWWYYKDFPIDETYKIKNLNEVNKIRNIILTNLDMYNKNIHKFDSYLSVIMDEELQFNNDLKSLFKVL